MIEKCLYYNNAQTACTLMIDDFVPVAVTFDGKAFAANDWGYLLDEEQSLYHYMKTNLLQKYPEIKGTFFIPLKSHHFLDTNTGYTIFKREFDNQFTQFAKRISNHFDFAFHGVEHTYKNIKKGKSEFRYEFQDLGLSDIEIMKSDIESFEQFFGKKLRGGKFPGNRGNELAYEIVEKLGFLWWTSLKCYRDYNLKNLSFQYFGIKNKILNIPQTFHGDAFKNYFSKRSSKKNFIKFIRDKYRQFTAERYLQFLYENRVPVTIQEHFQNASTYGKRQKPNVFDDIASLEKIFNLLRGADVWHVTSNDLAHYVESYKNTTIQQISENQYKIDYKGRWEKIFLSIMSNSKRIINLKTNEILNGIYKNGKWIYNYIKEGEYKICQ